MFWYFVTYNITRSISPGYTVMRLLPMLISPQHCRNTLATARDKTSRKFVTSRLPLNKGCN